MEERNWNLKAVRSLEWPTEQDDFLTLDSNEDVEAFRCWIKQGGIPDRKCVACRGRNTLQDAWDYGTCTRMGSTNLVFCYQSGDDEIFPIDSVNLLHLVQFALASNEVMQNAPQEPNKYVFLSYSRKDIQFANYLRATLQQEFGIFVWMDNQQLTPGMNWSSELERALNESGAVIVIMTPDAQESTFVQTEILHALDIQKPIFPVLLIGSSPLFLLTSKQFEDMRDGLSARPSPEFIQNLKTTLDMPTEKKEDTRTVQFEIVTSDVRKCECDVLVLKYAGAFYGADKNIFSAFKDAADTRNDPSFMIDRDVLNDGTVVLRETSGCISAKYVLYIPTVPMLQFDYASIRQLMLDAFSILSAKEMGRNKLHIAMTIHGVGIGLDETNCFEQQLQGIVEALTSSSSVEGPSVIERVSIIDFNSVVADRLNSVALQCFERMEIRWESSLLSLPRSPKNGEEDVITRAEIQKSYALFISPDHLSVGDTFYYGIQHPVHALGLLCERMETAGLSMKDDKNRLRQHLHRIQESKVVICEIDSFGNINKAMLCVLLGCAWGANIPTRLITQREDEGESLEFHPGDCLRYESIKDLSDQVSTWLKDTLA